jgi:hypothetical protein
MISATRGSRVRGRRGCLCPDAAQRDGWSRRGLREASAVDACVDLLRKRTDRWH